MSDRAGADRISASERRGRSAGFRWNYEHLSQKDGLTMYSKRIVLCGVITLIAASALSLLCGCGGANSVSARIPEAAPNFAYGPFTGRAAISSPPLITN